MLILVEDTNDNSPIFTSLPSEAVLVKENEKPGKVATFKAADRDSGAFGQVRIVLIEQPCVLCKKTGAAVLSEHEIMRKLWSILNETLDGQGHSKSFGHKAVFYIDICI